MEQTNSDVGQQPPWELQSPQPQQQQQQQSLQHAFPNTLSTMSPSLPGIPALSAISSLPSPSSASPTPFANPSPPWYSAPHPYQQHMGARRNEPMEFRPYGQQPPPPGPGQAHHSGPLQPPPMNVAQQQHTQHSAAQQHAQQSTPLQPAPQPQQQVQPQSATAASTPGSTPVPPRSRKRPNPSNAQPPATSASPIIPPPVPPSATPSATGTTPVGATSSTPGTAMSNVPGSVATTPAPGVVAASKPGPDEAGANPTPPPAKKSRTNTPWTPAEEHRLKQMRDAGRSWAEIAKSFPTRTEGSVKKHWYKDMHYAEFAEDESAALLNAIKEYENQKWKVIGQKVGKPAKACEQYAKEHFPDQVTTPSGKR